MDTGAQARTAPDTRPPGGLIEYRIEQPPETGRQLAAPFTAPQLAVLEKLNRADIAHLPLLAELAVPLAWHDDELQYSPFPLRYPAATGLPKLLVVDQRAQAFAAYESGALVRWGPVSTGGRVSQTPDGVFHLNWRSRGRHSTIDPDWYMEWYFNFHDTEGLALHSYALPGYPASHGCVRLLERDAVWLFYWGEGTSIANGRVARGTPVIVAGGYAFDAPPPWRSPERLASGIALPDLPPGLAAGT